MCLIYNSSVSTCISSTLFQNHALFSWEILWFYNWCQFSTLAQGDSFTQSKCQKWNKNCVSLLWVFPRVWVLDVLKCKHFHKFVIFLTFLLQIYISMDKFVVLLKICFLKQELNSSSTRKIAETLVPMFLLLLYVCTSKLWCWAIKDFFCHRS